MTAAILESVRMVNCLEIKRRMGGLSKRLGLPRYVIFMPDGTEWQSFQRLSEALKFCEKINFDWTNPSRRRFSDRVFWWEKD
jgi:hypothetical protein